jgi:hypothetical protein
MVSTAINTETSRVRINGCVLSAKIAAENSFANTGGFATSVKTVAVRLSASTNGNELPAACVVVLMFIGDTFTAQRRATSQTS